MRVSNRTGTVLSGYYTCVLRVYVASPTLCYGMLGVHLEALRTDLSSQYVA